MLAAAAWSLPGALAGWPVTSCMSSAALRPSPVILSMLSSLGSTDPAADLLGPLAELLHVAGQLGAGRDQLRDRRALPVGPLAQAQGQAS